MIVREFVLSLLNSGYYEYTIQEAGFSLGIEWPNKLIV